ncbi:hypothetical protein [Spongiactinospora sp. TRM90649]|uniref:hypothetical protein n=1 Tax=Spongiactinospora sp. TRM90649 TaxID=3031114 RepID=UPI0023FA1FB2|nr:hypothetical protein [Spongiactinospora sp. TRM90649]MDF5753196.1 hypothetical protein [Spongiactinospora sp. TRM90649]
MTRREKPAVPSTPRDVVHIRIGSFFLLFAAAVGVLGVVAHIYWLTIVMAVVAVVTIIDIWLAVHRQSAREQEGDGSAGLE